FFTKIGQVNGETGIFMGGQGAWIINHRIGIGGKGYGIVNKVEIGDLQNVKLEFGCGGALLEYIVASDELLHFNVHSMIGAGGVRYAVMDYQKDHSDIDYSDDGFFVLEPGIDLVLNVNKRFRIGVGTSYRFVNGVDYESLSNSDLNGLSAQVILKFGVF
ncbi:MAG: hypothetical protein OEQ53_11135, partial [Saprospiraceae bacterium]|nr:hypothetical protein [Saprospiraceae bacterium]